jgi:hypothetical protein
MPSVKKHCVNVNFLLPQLRNIFKLNILQLHAFCNSALIMVPSKYFYKESWLVAFSATASFVLGIAANDAIGSRVALCGPDRAREKIITTSELCIY